MSIKGKAYLMGAFEHPLRDAPDTSTAQLHAECARGALADAGLSHLDVDGYFCAGDAPGFGGMSMVDYMGLRNVRHLTPPRPAGPPTSSTSATRPRRSPRASARWR